MLKLNFSTTGADFDGFRHGFFSDPSHSLPHPPHPVWGLALESYENYENYENPKIKDFRGSPLSDDRFGARERCAKAQCSNNLQRRGLNPPSNTPSR